MDSRKEMSPFNAIGNWLLSSCSIVRFLLLCLFFVVVAKKCLKLCRTNRWTPRNQHGFRPIALLRCWKLAIKKDGELLATCEAANKFGRSQFKIRRGLSFKLVSMHLVRLESRLAKDFQIDFES